MKNRTDPKPLNGCVYTSVYTNKLNVVGQMRLRKLFKGAIELKNVFTLA